MLAEPGVAHAVSFPGLSINGFVNSPNSGIAFAGLADFSKDGKHVKTSGRSAWDIAASLNRKFAAIQDAYIAVFPPPAVQGLGTIGGFKMQIEDRAGLGFDTLYAETQKVVAAARADAGARERVLGLRDQCAANPRQRRSRQGASARRVAARSVRDHAGVLGLALRERLQPLRPHLSGHRAGRRAVPARARRHPAAQGAQRFGRDGAARLVRQARAELRAEHRVALQRLPVGRDHGRPRARVLVGPGAGRHREAGAAASCRMGSRTTGPSSCTSS